MERLAHSTGCRECDMRLESFGANLTCAFAALNVIERLLIRAGLVTEEEMKSLQADAVKEQHEHLAKMLLDVSAIRGGQGQ